MKKNRTLLSWSFFLLFCLLSYVDFFENAEHKFQDRVLRQEGPVDARIVLVGIDDKSLEVMGRWQDWSRYYHAQLLETISKGNPAVVGVDLIFTEASQDPDEDEALAEAAQNPGNVVLTSFGVFEEQSTGGEIHTLDFYESFNFLEGNFITGHINTIPDTDGVVRKTVLHYNHEQKKIASFAWTIYETYLQRQNQAVPDMAEIPLDPLNRMEITYAGRPGSFEHVSYYQVLNEEIPPEYFEGRIVLVGPFTVGIDDYYYTPLAPESPMYGVEIHANIIQNFLHQNFKTGVSYPLVFAILLGFGLGGTIIFNRLSPAKGLIILGLLMPGYVFFAQEAYQKGYILPLIYPLALGAVSYLAALAYRYLEELRERKRITGVFSRYVAPQVVGKILDEGEDALKLGGTRKEITVIFVDIRGFTPLSERAAPEEVVEILNEYLTLCANSIFKFQGTLDKFIGDATMALYNAPLDLEDHPFKAVQSAWAMKEGSGALQQMLEERFGYSVQFGIGVNTGYAVIGNIGAKFRMDYTAIGDTVNTAARLESNAKPGQILLSQAVYDRVKDRVQVTPLGEINVKGKAQGISIYQLDGLLE